jgi:hypothetical protein
MTKKRLTIDIDENLHAALKAESSAQGLHLGPFVEKILESRGESVPDTTLKAVDIASISTMSLNNLRELATTLGDTQPSDWKKQLNIVNTEIRRRYRV